MKFHYATRIKLDQILSGRHGYLNIIIAIPGDRYVYLR